MLKSKQIISALIHISIAIFFATIISPAPGLSAEKSQNTLVVSYDNWPPFTDGTDPDLGICFAIVNAAFKTTGYTIHPVTIPFKRADLYLRKGIEIDASPYYWYNEERAGYLYFSDPLLYNNVHFFIRSESKIKYDTLADLKGYKIGIIRGYHNGDAFDKATYLNKYLCNDNEQAIRMLETGRLDAAVLERVVAKAIISKLNFKNRLKALPKPLFTASLHFVVSKKNPNGKNIISAFNTGLKKIRRSGEYQQILDFHGITTDLDSTPD